MTWNVWWKFGPWEQRQGPILAELAAVDPDVVSLQEVWAEDGEDQARLLAGELELHVLRSRLEDGSPQPFGNAILSRSPIELLEQVTLPDINGRSTPRTALIARLDDEPGPRLYVNTHLDWRYYGSATRQRQLQVIVDAVDRHRDVGQDEGPLPVILTGDLNGQPETQELRRLTGLEPGYHPELIFIDCWAAVGDGPGHTWTRDNPHAAEASWPRRRLDYVLVSWPRVKPFCSPVSARLAGMGPVDGDGIGTEEVRRGGQGGQAMVPSDHYAVVVELDDRLAESVDS